MKVAVYGTLRQGNGNHRLLMGSDVELIGKGKLLEPATMYTNGGFPILSFDAPNMQQNIVVEVYEVGSDATVQRLDALEGYPRWYNRTEREFLLDGGGTVTAWIYHQDRAFSDLKVVESGDWEDVRIRYG